MAKSKYEQNKNNVRVIWKLRIDLPTMSTYLVLAFLKIQIVSGITIPNLRKAINPN